ncbi:MAG TPA: NTP transferase domain-containing protein [Paenalcaligenes sp.]|nr:NTP transferase domain-containing protein [Paenalcaligenes sp.]
MQIVILAAGRGSRLAQLGPAKPLVPVLGLPLLEHNLRQCLRLEPREILIVVGHAAEAIKNWLRLWQQQNRLRADIRCLFNPDWERYDNGHSLSCAAPHINGPFLLLMADHLYSQELLNTLCAQTPPAQGACLAVDTRLHRAEIDPTDATKVALGPRHLVRSLGKELTHYQGIDCGAFYCQPEVAEFSLRLDPEDSSRLSQIMQQLADQQRLQAVLHRHYWQDIDTPADRTRAERALLRHASQKNSDGPIARWLNRPVSQLLSRYFIRWRWSPNSISLLAFIIALLGALCLAQPQYHWLATGGILVQLASIVDGSDGEVARVQHRSSAYGGWFDALLDRYADIAVLSALTWHVINHHDPIWMWLGISAIAGSFVSSYSAHKADQRLGFKPLRIGRDLRCLIIALSALCAQPLWGLGLISLIMNLTVLYRMYLLYPGKHTANTP